MGEIEAICFSIKHKGNFEVPLKLHNDLRARLIHALANGLPKLEVRNGKYFASGSRMPLFEAENALPDHGSLREQLVALIDDFPIVTFAHDILQTELMELDRYDSQSQPQKLTEIEEFTNADTVAQSLVEQFASLPWRYTLSIKLPHEISTFLAGSITDVRRLSSRIRLVRAADSLANNYPLNASDKNRQKRIHGSGSLLFPESDRAWSEGSIYLQIETEGFIGPFGGSMPAIEAERLLKSFLGLGIALRLFQVGNVFSFVPPVEHFYVHKADNDRWEIDSRFEITADSSRILSEITLNSMITDAATEQRKRGLLETILEEASAVFSGADKSESILLAAEWLLESYAGRDDRLNFVKSIVVLEVMLGDKATSDVLGLGQLLRNRCAYLIGRNQEDRNALLKDFDEIYKIRSQIVHRGKARLSFKERVLFRTLRSICDRVIQREVDLLRAK